MQTIYDWKEIAGIGLVILLCGVCVIGLLLI